MDICRMINVFLVIVQCRLFFQNKLLLCLICAQEIDTSIDSIEEHFVTYHKDEDIQTRKVFEDIFLFRDQGIWKKIYYWRFFPCVKIFFY